MRRLVLAQIVILAVVVVLLGVLAIFFGKNASADLSQVATFVVLAWTLWVVRDYAADTRVLASQAKAQTAAVIDQRDWTLRPCVVVRDLEVRDTTDVYRDASVSAIRAGSASGYQSALYRLPATFSVENCGVGPALDIELKKTVHGSDTGPRRRIPHLRVGEVSAATFSPIPEPSKEWWLQFRYMGVSGEWFVSRYYLIGEVAHGFTTFPLKKGDPDAERIREGNWGDTS